MPDSGASPPDKTPSRRPTLADQHWRAQLRRKSQKEAGEDMLQAIEKNDGWRFSMLMQLDIDWAGQDHILRKTVECGRAAMFQAMADKNADWSGHANLQSLAGAAAETGRLDFVKLFVEQYKVDIHYYTEEMLRASARNGHEEVVGYLLSKGADHSAWNGDPLKAAVENGHFGVVKKLVDAGADVNDTYGDVLDRAARGGHMEIFEYLLSKGADPKAGNYDAFMTACRNGKTGIVKALMDHGVEAGARDNDGFIAACEGKHFDTAKLLLDKGASVDAQQGRALRLAAGRADIDTIKFLLDNKANPNLSQYRETPLTEAVRSGKTEVVELLIAGGANHALLDFEAWRMARRERKRDMQEALLRAERAARERLKIAKLSEFNQVFSGGFSVDDLRARKGPSGDTGLLLAARSGKFADVLRRAKGGSLVPDDLFHPEDRLDSVASVLYRNKTLQQFFDPAFWADRTGQVLDAYESLPAALQKRVKLDSIAAQVNQRKMMQKMKGASGLKPPKIGKH